MTVLCANGFQGEYTWGRRPWVTNLVALQGLRFEGAYPLGVSVSARHAGGLIAPVSHLDAGLQAVPPIICGRRVSVRGRRASRGGVASLRTSCTIHGPSSVFATYPALLVWLVTERAA